MFTLARLAMVASAILPLVSGCGSSPGSSPEPARSTEAKLETYQLTGTVVAVDKPGKLLTVNHEDIPGFMTAMTMAYPVKEDRTLDTLSPGQRITAKVVGNAGGYWLEQIAVEPSRDAPE